MGNYHDSVLLFFVIQDWSFLEERRVHLAEGEYIESKQILLGGT